MNDTQNLPTPHELLAAAVQVAAKVLSKRLILLVGLTLDFLLFAWAAYAKDPYSLVAAGAFGLLVWVSVSFPIN